MDTEKAATRRPRRPRRDAERNRQLILDAARAVFAEQGLDAALDEIARRAGVGSATLYRRFPRRELLYAAVFASLGDALRGLSRHVLLINDAWSALTTYVEGLCALTASDRGVRDMIMSGFPDPPSLAKEIQDTLRELVNRMQRQGLTRADVTFVDVQLCICSVLLMIPAMVVTPQSWHRYLTLTLDGLRPSAFSQLPVPPLTEEQFHEIALQLFPAMRDSESLSDPQFIEPAGRHPSRSGDASSAG